MLRSVFRLILATLALALLSACGRNLDRADLVFINGAELEPLDPPLITAQGTGRVAYALFEGLTIFDAKAVPQPGVAERWEVSPDGLVYTFHLRKDAKWSTGDPVTSADFVYAWQRALKPETASEYASQMYFLRNAREFNQGKLKDPAQIGVKGLDDWTLEVTLESPTPFFLDLCAFATYLPVHRATVERHSDWSTKAEHFVGNGPFVLKDWRLFDRVRLEKSPTYWNKETIPMNSIDILPSAKANTAFNLYATGVADLMMDKSLTPTPLLTELKKRKDFHASPFLGNYFIRYNTKGKFKDPRVRKAFSLVIDKKLITDKITRAGEIPARSLTPPGTGTGYEPGKGLDYNPELARQLMAEAGYPGGRGFPIFSYLYKADADIDRDIAVELQGMFARELGVNMQLQAQEWTVYLNSQSNLNYDLCRSTWVADYNDPNTFLNMFVTGDGNNRTGWSNPKYDELIAAAGRELDPAKRYDLFRQAEAIMIEQDVPICPLYYYVGIQFFDPDKLGGIIPNLLDEHPLRYLHWKQAQR